MGSDGKAKQQSGGTVSFIDSAIVQRYDIRKRLGKGAYGIVWKAVERSSGKVVALKKIYDAFRNAVDAQRTFREVMFLRAFSGHENIVRLFGVLRAGSDADIYLVFEYMETDLHRVIKKGGVLKDIHKRFIMYQLLKATMFLHSAGVIHRDQKPSNILLDSECRVKIADFGLARSISGAELRNCYTGQQPVLTDYVATRWYRAPEILLAAKRYTGGVDMWSLGCILAEMLLEKPIFAGSSTLDQIQLIRSCLGNPDRETLLAVSTSFSSSLLCQSSSHCSRRPLRSLFDAGVSGDAVSLVCQLLVMHPVRRLTAQQALTHRYVKCFHNAASEPVYGRPFVPSIDDCVQLTTDEYRSHLYACVADTSCSTPTAGGTITPTAGGTITPAAGGTITPAAGGTTNTSSSTPTAGGTTNTSSSTRTAGGTITPAAAGTCDRVRHTTAASCWPVSVTASSAVSFCAKDHRYSTASVARCDQRHPLKCRLKEVPLAPVARSSPIKWRHMSVNQTPPAEKRHLAVNARGGLYTSVGSDTVIKHTQPAAARPQAAAVSKHH